MCQRRMIRRRKKDPFWDWQFVALQIVTHESLTWTCNIKTICLSNYRPLAVSSFLPDGHLHLSLVTTSVVVLKTGAGLETGPETTRQWSRPCHKLGQNLTPSCLGLKLPRLEIFFQHHRDHIIFPWPSTCSCCNVPNPGQKVNLCMWSYVVPINFKGLCFKILLLMFKII